VPRRTASLGELSSRVPTRVSLWAPCPPPKGFDHNMPAPTESSSRLEQGAKPAKSSRSMRKNQAPLNGRLRRASTGPLRSSDTTSSLPLGPPSPRPCVPILQGQILEACGYFQSLA